MTRLSVEPVNDPPQATVTPIRPSPTPETPIPEPVAAPQPRLRFAAPPQPDPAETALAVAVTAFSGLGFALSARAILLLVLVGAFVLGAMVMQQPDMIRLGALVAYGLLMVLPCVWLERFKGR